ncbi:MAG: hypothetical protein JRH03_03070, partial [Deltaproteobacteria bacterium]|nr:hypothetical protein [Deltaproteobacteria bacterium]
MIGVFSAQATNEKGHETMRKPVLKILTAVALAALLWLPVQAAAFERYNRVKRFDPYFSKYAKRYFGPAFD